MMEDLLFFWAACLKTGRRVLRYSAGSPSVVSPRVTASFPWSLQSPCCTYALAAASCRFAPQGAPPEPCRRDYTRLWVLNRMMKRKGIMIYKVAFINLKLKFVSKIMNHSCLSLSLKN